MAYGGNWLVKYWRHGSAAFRYSGTSVSRQSPIYRSHLYWGASETVYCSRHTCCKTLAACCFTVTCSLLLEILGNCSVCKSQIEQNPYKRNKEKMRKIRGDDGWLCACFKYIAVTCLSTADIKWQGFGKFFFCDYSSFSRTQGTNSSWLSHMVWNSNALLTG